MMSFLLLFLSPESHAEGWDTSFALMGRTRALAAQLEATGGYGWVMWGEENSENPMYGYVRPNLSVRGPSSLTGVAGVDIYPLSFLGFTIGRQYMRRLVEQPEIDCDRLECEGWLNHTFLRARAVGEYAGFFAMLTFEKTDYDAFKSLARPVFQSNNAVVQNANGDRGDDWNLAIGYNLNEEWRVGVSGQEFRTEITRNHQDQQLLFVGWKRDKWECLGGIGRFASTPLGATAQLAGSCSWNLFPKIGF